EAMSADDPQPVIIAYLSLPEGEVVSHPDATPVCTGDRLQPGSDRNGKPRHVTIVEHTRSRALATDERKMHEPPAGSGAVRGVLRGVTPMAEEDPEFGDQEAYYELAGYTLVHPDPAFIHQYIVDAYAAQHADAHCKPISISFALAGLYLHLERGYSGKAVQR